MEFRCISIGNGTGGNHFPILEIHNPIRLFTLTINLIFPNFAQTLFMKGNMHLFILQGVHYVYI